MSPDAEPEGLGGWMVLVMIGLYATPLRLFGTVLEVYHELGRHPVWTTEMHTLMAWTVVLSAIPAALAIYTIVQAHNRSPSFPIAYQVMWLVATLIALLWPLVVFPSIGVPSTPAEWATVFMTGAIGAVWSLYVNKSRRVYNTFLRQRPPA